MSPVRAGLVMMGFSVTTDARYVGVVGLIDMAIRTHCAVMRQAPEVVVIEGGPQPARCIVTARGGAICRDGGEAGANLDPAGDGLGGGENP